MMCLVLVIAGVQAGNQNEGKDKVVTALPPHSLDDVFNKDTERAMIAALLDSKLFKHAMKEAYQAKLDQEKKFKDDPKLRDASPNQAARRKFLEVLSNDKGVGQKKPD